MEETLIKPASVSQSVLAAQTCLALCDPMDYSPPSSSVRGILQARILEWVAILPGDPPDPGIKPRSPALQEYSLPSEPPRKHKACIQCSIPGHAQYVLA